MGEGAECAVTAREPPGRAARAGLCEEVPLHAACDARGASGPRSAQGVSCQPAATVAESTSSRPQERFSRGPHATPDALTCLPLRGAGLPPPPARGRGLRVLPEGRGADLRGPPVLLAAVLFLTDPPGFRIRIRPLSAFRKPAEPPQL